MARFVALRALAVAIAWTSALVTVGVEARAVEFRQRFQQSIGEPMLVVSSPEAEPYVKRTEGGLLVTFPGSKGAPLPAAGVTAQFHVRGDFEVTAAYELIDVAPPDGGWGAGVMLRVNTESKTGDSATLGRYLHPRENQVFASDRSVADGAGGEKHAGQYASAHGKNGRLRLSRTGRKLTYQVADDGESAFRQVREENFSDADVNWLLFAAVTGLSKTPLRVRLIELDIRAEKLPLLDDSSDATGTFIAWTLISSAGIVVASVAVLKSRNRKLYV